MENNKIKKFFIDYWWILKGKLYDMRLEWKFYIILISLSPLSYLFFLWFYGGMGDYSKNLYIVTGSVANSAVTAAMLGLGQSIGSLRLSHVMEYYATYPISKLSFILALASKGVIFSIPSAIIILVIGGPVLGVPVISNLIPIFIVYFAGAFSLAGLGAIIGFYGSTPYSSSMITQIVSPLIVLFAPVYFPLFKLPRFLQISSHVIPTTYVARGMRQAITTPYSTGYWLNILILLGFTIVGLVASVYKTSWRVTSTEAK
ncbi:ABC transporter permease [Clostridium sp. 'deep sea']|uniref:ABC transporter permease n=1 Tax=Clostridium sp. 'deep sea' TaxID=2779445 RepID=UPI0018964A79|nr:ABC transporter permease [Clostridium sp. 'deep sea']QOR34623.1 ABC transporter permease [Clostridium sp. 'deep sea']